MGIGLGSNDSSFSSRFEAMTMYYNNATCYNEMSDNALSLHRFVKLCVLNCSSAELLYLVCCLCVPCWSHVQFPNMVGYVVHSPTL